jgi:hypothetical protein
MAKTVTISREAHGWYAYIACADAPAQLLPAAGQDTGIGLGIEAFATLSSGTRIFSPNWYRKAERALKAAQRRVSRRRKGSQRRRKSMALLAKARQTACRRRADFHHKTALQMVRERDAISPEDLQTANILKTTIAPGASPLSRRHAPVDEWLRWILPAPARPVLAVAFSSPRAYRSAGARALGAAGACAEPRTPPGTTNGAGSQWRGQPMARAANGAGSACGRGCVVALENREPAAL